MEFKLTDDIEKRLKAGESITVADVELLCLRFTIKVSKIQGLAYGLATYVDIGDCLDTVYIDGIIIDCNSNLEADANKYLTGIRDKFETAAKQLHKDLADAAKHDQIQSAVISYSGY